MTPAAHLQIQSEPDKLQFLELDEWDGLSSYEEEVPTHLHYSIGWKVMVNNKVTAKDTEQDLVLVSIAYWHMVLQPKLEKLLRRKLAPNRQVRCHDKWAADNSEEVSFQDFQFGAADGKAGYKKIQFCAQKAAADGLRYFQMDTCCIDRSNSTELSGALNSMFR